MGSCGHCLKYFNKRTYLASIIIDDFTTFGIFKVFILFTSRCSLLPWKLGWTVVMVASSLPVTNWLFSAVSTTTQCLWKHCLHQTVWYQCRQHLCSVRLRRHANSHAYTQSHSYYLTCWCTYKCPTESAVSSINARRYAAKQRTCAAVSLFRWVFVDLGKFMINNNNNNNALCQAHMSHRKTCIYNSTLTPTCASGLCPR